MLLGDLLELRRVGGEFRRRKLLGQLVVAGAQLIQFFIKRQYAHRSLEKVNFGNSNSRGGRACLGARGAGSANRRRRTSIFSTKNTLESGNTQLDAPAVTAIPTRNRLSNMQMREHKEEQYDEANDYRNDAEPDEDKRPLILSARRSGNPK